MTAVAAAIVRCERALSGGATARVVGDVGGGRDRPPRPFGCRAVMITHVCAPCYFGVVGPAHQWQMQPPAVNAWRTRFREYGSPRSINHEKRRGKSLTSSLSTRCPSLFAFASRLRAPLLSPAACFVFARRRQPQWLRPSQSWCWICCHGID
jgi:hypothetical protein